MFFFFQMLMLIFIFFYCKCQTLFHFSSVLLNWNKLSELFNPFSRNSDSSHCSVLTKITPKTAVNYSDILLRLQVVYLFTVNRVTLTHVLNTVQ